MARSLRKVPFVHHSLIKAIKVILKEGGKKVIKTWSRASTIVPEMVGMTIAVHNGREHIPVYIDELKIGRKLGEFSHTRTFKGHSGDRKGGKK